MLLPIMPMYTNVEMAGMIFMYGWANGNTLDACRMYAQTYPNRECLSHLSTATG